MHLSTVAAFAITSATLACTVAGDRAEIADLDPGTTYYCRVVGRDVLGNRGTEGAEVSVAAGYAGPLDLYPAAFAGGFAPPNNGFEVQSDASAPPDNWRIWEVGTPPWATWGTDWLVDSAGASGNRAVKAPTSAGSVGLESDLFPVDPAQSYQVEASWKYGSNLGSSADQVQLSFYDASLTYLSSGDSLYTLPGSVVGTWHNRAGLFAAPPAGARYARVGIWKAGLGVFPTYELWVDRVRVVSQQKVTWTAPTLTNSWVNYGGGRNNAGYTKTADGRVTLRGVIKSGALGAAAFTLPVGYRPAATLDFACVANAGAGLIFGALAITSAGVVTPFSGSNLQFSLEGVSFFTD